MFDKDTMIAAASEPLASETESVYDHNQYEPSIHSIRNAEELSEMGEINELHTVKEVQQAINETHPFGLKIWKPALYKKNRSIDMNLYYSLHPSSLHEQDPKWTIGNVLWLVLFGSWMALSYATLALLFYLSGKGIQSSIYVSTSLSSMMHRKRQRKTHFLFPKLLIGFSRCLYSLSGYVLFPFGKYLMHSATFKAEYIGLQEMNEEEESGPLLGPHLDDGEYERFSVYSKSRLNGLIEAVFRGVLFVLLGPLHLLTIFTCFFMIVPIPMAKFSQTLLSHLIWHPLELKVWSRNELLIQQNDCEMESEFEGTPKSTLSHNFEPPRKETPQKNMPGSYSLGMSPSLPRYASLHEHDFSSRTPSVLVPNDQRSVIFPSDQRGGNLSNDQRGWTLSNDQRSGILSNDPKSIFRRKRLIISVQKAMGIQYYKYTIDGINVVFINLISVILFTFFDYYYLAPRLGHVGIGSHSTLFVSALLSVIPLAYFIGMSVSSITAQTGSLALGAVINATFGSIIEVILYCFALLEGKERLVEGSIIGSFLCGLLALPGAAMFAGGLMRKEQTFNAKSAGVTSTMLILALIGVFTPTLFQDVYGSFNMICHECPSPILSDMNGSQYRSLSEQPVSAVVAQEIQAQTKSFVGHTRLNGNDSCRTCFYEPTPPALDPVYQSHTKPLSYLCVCVLLLTYAIGLLFTLRTHAKRIYPPLNRPMTGLKEEKDEEDEKRTLKSRFKPLRNRMSRMWSNVSGLSHRMTSSHFISNVYGKAMNGAEYEPGVSSDVSNPNSVNNPDSASSPDNVNYPNNMRNPNNMSSPDNVNNPNNMIDPNDNTSNPGSTSNPNDIHPNIMHNMPDYPRKLSSRPRYAAHPRLDKKGAFMSTYGAGVYVQPLTATSHKEESLGTANFGFSPGFPDSNTGENPRKDELNSVAETELAGPMSHSAPNWSTAKSIAVLFLSTLAFSMIAEILVATMDAVLSRFTGVDEKLVGLTLFAVVPSVTEFYNAIAFAAGGDIVLGLEIGSAYTIQVALLQIPALVMFSAYLEMARSKDVNITDSPLRYPFQKWTEMHNRSRDLSDIANSGNTSEISDIISENISENGENISENTENISENTSENSENSGNTTHYTSAKSHQDYSLFTLVFPRFDFVAVLLSTFILTYIYIEGKSNYFKGSILLLAYVVLMSAFFVIPSRKE